MKESQKRYLERHPERRRESSHKYYEKNKELIKQRTKKYRESPEYKAIKLNSKHKRRSREKNTDITKRWLLDLMARTPECMICDAKLTKDNRQLDHITPLNVGGTHTRDNVRYVCAKCNQRRPKSGKDEVENFQKFIVAFLDFNNWECTSI